MSTKRHLRVVDDKPPAEAQPDMMTLRLLLALMVDGQAVAHLPFELDLPRPAAGQSGNLQIALNGRRLAALLEPHIGPATAKPKLWTPGG